MGIDKRVPYPAAPHHPSIVVAAPCAGLASKNKRIICNACNNPPLTVGTLVRASAPTNTPTVCGSCRTLINITYCQSIDCSSPADARTYVPTAFGMTGARPAQGTATTTGDGLVRGRHKVRPLQLAMVWCETGTRHGHNN